VFAPPAGYAPPPQGYGPWTPQPVIAQPVIAQPVIAQPVIAQPVIAPPAARGPAIGLVAFLLGLGATVIAPIVAGIAAYTVGLGMRGDVLDPTDLSFDWSAFSPVREWVLAGEIAFWSSTVLGIWALVQGIVAISRARGRGWGIAAVVLALLGPIVFFTVLWTSLLLGAATP
jgi:hypothetical protein